MGNYVTSSKFTTKRLFEKLLHLPAVCTRIMFFSALLLWKLNMMKKNCIRILKGDLVVKFACQISLLKHTDE